MEKLPDEVLLKICGQLDFSSVANLRRVNRHLAEVGAEGLVKRVRFHCHQDSLQRLSAIATHEVFSRYVDTVVFEGNLLADLGCVHSYSAHYDLEHHRTDRPQAPPRDASAREKRHFERNMAKFHREIEAKYVHYRDYYDTQQELIASTAYADLIAPSILRFPRVNKIVLSTVGRCKHVLSQRFLESFKVDCAMPIENDTKHTKEQLKHLLLPKDQPLEALRSLEVQVVTPKFFGGFVPRALLCEAFKNLRTIDLNFRLERLDRHDMEVSPSDRYQTEFRKGHLREALTAATGLQELTINFEDFGFQGACANLKLILGDHVWPNLTSLDLDCLITTQDYLISMLKRQPCLTRLRLGLMTLEDGEWTDTTEMMRNDLHLTTFVAHGVLEDQGIMHAMHLIDSDMYIDDDYAQFTLTDALDAYVTDKHWRDDGDYHPLNDQVFADPEELREEFGPFEDGELSDMSDMDCSD